MVYIHYSSSSSCSRRLTHVYIYRKREREERADRGEKKKKITYSTAGIYIFRPLVMEARIKRLQEQGADVGAVGNEAKMAQEIKEHNEKERERAAAAAAAAAGRR